jgi:AmmeMemoRadiSam system protein A
MDDSSINLSPDDRAALLHVARESVRHGLDRREPLPVDASRYSLVLQQVQATFVTLHVGGRLRGCIGALEARRPLIEDVSRHAFAAAFRDSRFTPVQEVEFLSLSYHISILSSPEPMAVASEQDLLSRLRPGIDGVILDEPPRRATFLPQVWEMAPRPADFLALLKTKGGWPAGYWSRRIKVSRYTTLSVE